MDFLEKMVTDYMTYMRDPTPDKVDLMIGQYRDENGEILVLPIVAEVDREQVSSRCHGYQSFTGEMEFGQLATQFLLGRDHEKVKDGTAYAVQTMGGTGALCIGSKILSKNRGWNKVLLSTPTYSNYNDIFKNAGCSIGYYRYYNKVEKVLDFDGLIEDLETSEPAIVVLQVCSHNPSGIDPSVEQWRQIADVVKSKGHFPFLDAAYLGFVSGVVETDASPVKMFIEAGLRPWTALSFSKTLGLYGERVGALVMVEMEPMTIPSLIPFMKIAYSNYNCPVRYGMELVRGILRDETHQQELRKDLWAIKMRISLMRNKLQERLGELAPAHDWSHITRSEGMFTCIGLSEEEVKRMGDCHHVYAMRNSRMNVSVLNLGNMERVARAIADVVNENQ